MNTEEREFNAYFEISLLILSFIFCPRLGLFIYYIIINYHDEIKKKALMNTGLSCFKCITLSTLLIFTLIILFSFIISLSDTEYKFKKIIVY